MVFSEGKHTSVAEALLDVLEPPSAENHAKLAPDEPYLNVDSGSGANQM